MEQQGTIARAFELARGGNCHSIGDIRRELIQEGHSRVQEHLAGSLIKRQLAALMKL